jgi:DUF1365 family protein
MVIQPGVYVGRLRHRRRTPQPHEFAYPLFMVLLDVERIPDLMGASFFTSHNRFNWATFDDRDHLGNPSRPLRERIEADAASHGITLPDGRIFLLTHLRCLGYCFNPVSFFYCFDRDENLRFVMAEVHNTFGGACNYWVRPHDRTAKALPVSPFMESDLQYDFAFSRPEASLVAHIDTLKNGRSFFDATLTLRRRPWNAAEIRRALARHPAMTAMVIAGIHWQAARLWWKGLPVRATFERA